MEQGRGLKLPQRLAERRLEMMALELEQEEMLARTPAVGSGLDPPHVDLALREAAQHFQETSRPVLQGEEEDRLVPAAGLGVARAEHVETPRPARRVLCGGIQDGKAEALRHDRRGETER